MKMYEVGGCVRDEIIGVPSKDIDFTVVIDHYPHVLGGPFEAMVANLKAKGFRIFLETPEFLTVRAQFPKTEVKYKGLTADFVLARKESDYADGRRPDKVEPGTLMDDLKRRDFTMNAIAKDEDGTYIDPFNGQAAIAERFIYAVGNAQERLSEDALRAVRALRFSVTKRFYISPAVSEAMESDEVLDAIELKISDERIQVELSKMFRFDTPASLKILSEYSLLTEAMFAGKVSLDATLKTKGRGK